MSESANRSSADEVKAKFRDALDRKTANNKNGEAHRDGSAKVNHVHGAVAGKREFRRKSG